MTLKYNVTFNIYRYTTSVFIPVISNNVMKSLNFK